MIASMRKPPNLAQALWLNDKNLQAVLSVLNGAGETRVAGGAIRNALMGLPISDVDLATVVLPHDVMQLAKSAGFAAHPTGIEHGTITVVNHGKPFEVTTLRRDVETDGRHAVVKFTNDFAADAARRDFTMNALYCNARGEIFDYTDGYTDIRKHRVRFAGQPAARIKEDFLRILRFFRFHATYGKGAPDAFGLAACARLKAGLKDISAERIRQELFKLLTATRAPETLKVMAASGVLKTIIPYVAEWRVVKRLPADPILRLMAIAKAPNDLKELLRLSNQEAARIERLLAAPALTPILRDRERRVLLYATGKETWRDQVELTRARSKVKLTDQAWMNLLNFADEWPIAKLPLSGKDLLQKGILAGPQLGALLQAAEDYWIAGDFKASREDLLNYLESVNE